MSTRRSTMPALTAFGGLLRSLRAERQVSNGWTEIELSKVGAGAQVNASTLSQYENGNVWAPDPVVLMELARLYRASPLGLIAVLKANRQNPSLSADDAKAVYEGTINAESAAPGLLADRTNALEAVAGQIESLARQLVVAAENAHAAAKKGRPTRVRKAGRGGSD